MGRAVAPVKEAKGWAHYDLRDRGDPGQLPRSLFLMASMICLKMTEILNCKQKIERNNNKKIIEDEKSRISLPDE